MSYPVLGVPIRTAILATAGITNLLPAYLDSKTVFNRRPVPADATYPMIVVSPDISKTDNDGIDDQRPIIERDITTYGQNDKVEKYNTVESIARQVHDLFHGRRESIVVTGWHVIQVLARGPIPAPVDDDQNVARMVTLTIQLAKQN